MDKSAGLVRAANFNFLSICMRKLLFSQGGTWAFVMIIYLYCNRPRKPQRGPCNVRGHRATALTQDTREVDRGSQDGLMLPGKMDVCPPTGSMRRHQASPCHAHMGSGALQVSWLQSQQVKSLHCRAPQHCIDGQMDTPRSPSCADPQGSPQGARQGRCPYRTRC